MDKKYTIQDLSRKNIVVYDLEIKKTIDQCSKGWSSLDEMGISCGASFDYRTFTYTVYMDDNICSLVERLNEPGTLIVAFNHINFDNKLLRASGLPLKEDSELNNYDMLQVSRVGAGISKDGKFEGRFVGGFKLDDHLSAMELPIKTADGAQAPIMYQQGRMGELITYCLNDVKVEKTLFEHMYLTGHCSSGFKQFYKIERPVIG